jgi:hypothetical protein
MMSYFARCEQNVARLESGREIGHVYRDKEAGFGNERRWFGFQCPGMMQASRVRWLKASPLLEFVSR